MKTYKVKVNYESIQEFLVDAKSEAEAMEKWEEQSPTQEELISAIAFEAIQIT